MKKGKKQQPDSRKKNTPREETVPALEDLILSIEHEIQTVQNKGLKDTAFDLEDSRDKVDIGRHICVQLGERQLAIPLDAVMEAGEYLPVRSLPLLPDWITGIANIRGEIISVVDLGLFFNIEKGNKSDISIKKKPYLIIYNNIMKVAILVNKIVATRPLFSMTDDDPKKIQKNDDLSQYFSGKAFFDRENIREELFRFDLDKFLSSGRLHDFSTA